MAESILLVFTGLIFVVISVVLAINAEMSPGAEGERTHGGFLFGLGLWLFMVGAVTLFTGWVAG